MLPNCPACFPLLKRPTEFRNVIRNGQFWRKSDGRWIQRFLCHCGKSFSHATGHPCFRQKKRHLNHRMGVLFASAVSQRRVAIFFGVNRTTVVRKFRFLASQARLGMKAHNHEEPLAEAVQFDDMESFEHSKYKPLSITLAVVEGKRRVLGFQVSEMPAKGPLAAKSRQKYGRRRDGRAQARKILFAQIQPLIRPGAVIKSDESPHYPSDVKKYFPESQHITFKGRRAAANGYGEMKNSGPDPLFSLNHTAAMFRANMSRLLRKTWNTTKTKQGLIDHISVYVLFHNKVLLKKSRTA